MTTLTLASAKKPSLYDKLSAAGCNYKELASGARLYPKVPLSIFSELRDNRLQRNHKDRVNKMAKKYSPSVPTLSEVQAVIATTDLTGEYYEVEIDVPAGEESKVNGHTRNEYWTGDKFSKLAAQQGHVPEMVSLTVYEVDTWDDYKKLYDSFDSPDAVETSNNKIQSAIRAIGIPVTSKMAMGGKFGTALRHAYPGDDKEPVFTKVAYFADEISDLDRAGGFEPNEKGLKFQALTSAMLAALKVWDKPDSNRQRLLSGISQIVNFDKDRANWSSSEWNGIDAILKEFGSDGTMLPSGVHRSTKYADVDMQLDFIWYWLEIYMNKKTILKTNSFNTKHAKGKYKEFMELLDTMYPTN
jgi:hypothetical protein